MPKDSSLIFIPAMNNTGGTFVSDQPASELGEQKIPGDRSPVSTRGSSATGGLQGLRCVGARAAPTGVSAALNTTGSFTRKVTSCHQSFGDNLPKQANAGGFQLC